jgi:CO/xanthine dehydrogenase FAD-binding subunit
VSSRLAAQPVGYAQGDVDAAMKAAPFDYLRPDTLDETLAALTQYGSDARIIAGGQSLGAMLSCASSAQRR